MWPFGAGEGRSVPENTTKGPTAGGGRKASLSADAEQTERRSLTALLVLSILFTVSIGFVAPAWDTYLQLIARQDVFGIAALCGGATAVLLFVALALREVRSLLRLRRIEGIRRLGLELREQPGIQDDTLRLKAAMRILRGVIALYRDQQHCGVKVVHLIELRKTKPSSPEMILQAIETNALDPLDAEALLIVRRAALRVGTITAISPWGALDALIVAYMNLTMVRALAQHYNARPGLLSTLKMSLGYIGSVGAAHALGWAAASIAEQVANRIAAYLLGGLAKGAANATSTALLGLFVVSAVRPIPFVTMERPGLLDLAFPANSVVAKVVDLAGQVKDGAAGAFQGLVGRSRPGSTAEGHPSHAEINSAI